MQKPGQWRRPALGVAAPAGVSPDALWAQGQAAEDAYDYEAARAAYRLAAAAASSGAALAYVTKYAAFLCERFGQFDEVAAWLDDPGFALPTGKGGEAMQLSGLLARAAMEVKHPRHLDVDAHAAQAGDPGALQRVQQRDAQHRQEALALAHAALAPVDALLAAGDLEGVAQALATLRTAHGATPPFAALQGRLLAAQAKHALAQQRHALHALLAAGDVRGAELLAAKIAAHDHATPADKQALAGIRQVRAADAQATLWRQAQSATPARAQLEILAQLVDDHGTTLDAPAPLHTLWQMVRLVAQLPHALPLRPRVPALVAWQTLVTHAESADFALLESALHALPEAWLTAPLPRHVRERVRAHAESARVALEAEITAQVETLLAADALDEAARVLDAAQRTHGAGLTGLKALRATLSHQRHQRERTDKLRRAIQDALDVQDVLIARARLAELAHVVPDDEAEAWRQEIETRAGPLLRAKPMPPGMQKLEDAALLTGAGLDRLVIVQNTVWLTINRTTGGIQPFALPSGWPVQIHAWTRIAAVGDALRLVGVSQGRLVVIEQVLGQPPHVVAGVPLAELLAEDDTLMGAVLTPDAPTWVLLSRHAQKGTAPTWTRIDARTLEVLDRKKAQPKLDSLAGIDGAPGEAILVPALKHRGAFAMAVADTTGHPLQRFSSDDVGEPVADVLQAQAWPAEGRIFARYGVRDPFQPDRITRDPSLLVIKQGRIAFASTDLRRRFAPLSPMRLDHAWTLDPAAGRLWLAAVSTAEGEAQDALLLGVDARTLRADKPVAVADVTRILALHPVTDGAVALTRLRAGGYGLTRATMATGALQLTTQRLPL